MGWTEDWAEETGTAHSVVVHLHGSLTRDELAALCQRVRALIWCGPCDGLVCDVSAIEVADLDLVDQLARLRLAARRAGGMVTFRCADEALQALLTLVGLDEFLMDAEAGTASVESQRQAEQCEKAGVEKDIEVHHPPL
jgi:ABC-type transporter Mla MlaB component